LLADYFIGNLENYLSFLGNLPTQKYKFVANAEVTAAVSYGVLTLVVLALL